MVADSRATVRADRLRPLNAPRRVRVETDERDRPVAVYVRGQGTGDRGQGDAETRRRGDTGDGGQGDAEKRRRGDTGDGGQGDAETRRRGDPGGAVPSPRPRVAASPRRVTESLDRWRIDDEWWRREISRMYYHVALEGGLLFVLFHDLIGGGWFVQTTATKRGFRNADPGLRSARERPA